MRKKEVKNKNKYLVPFFLLLLLVIVLIWLYKVGILTKNTQEQAKIEKPDNLELLKLAISFYNSGNYVEAIRQYENILKSDPQFYGAYVGLGDSYIQLGIYDEAIKTFEKTKSLKYYDFRTYYGLGLAYYRMEDYNNAYLNLNYAYKLNPNNNAVVSYLINTYNAVGLYDEAVKLAEEKLKNDPNNSHYYRKIAIAYFLKNDLPKALENAQKAVMIYNNYAGNDLTLGTIYIGLGQKENALSEFKAALIQPQHTAYEGLVVTYDLLGEKENSEENAKASAFYPKHSNSLSLLGFALLDIKEYDKAIREFNLAISNTLEYYLPYKGLGKVYLQLGQKEKAIENFDKAYKLNNLDEESSSLLEMAKKLQ